MVHALREAHRVLKPHGLLVDLRPADRERQVFHSARRVSQPLGRIRVNDADVRSADAALHRLVDQGLFYSVAKRTFRVRRHFSSLQDWRAYLDAMSSSTPGTGLLENVRHAFKSGAGHSRVVLEMDLTLHVLTRN